MRHSDWQNFLDKLERCAVALETIAVTVADQESLKTLAASLKAHDKPLETALSASAGPTGAKT